MILILTTKEKAKTVNIMVYSIVLFLDQIHLGHISE